jgi:hypothetical protein
MWADVLGWPAPTWSRLDHPYAALASVVSPAKPELLAPQGWRFAAFANGLPADASIRGAMLAVGGERQTPDRALLVPLPDAPAVVAGRGYCYINGNPFAAFQAWLQGQEDLQPWLAWRHRLFWLDEWVSSLATLLAELPALPEGLPRPGIPALASTTVVLRHDVDHSTDASYLHHEEARNVAATHAVLRDKNARFWRNELHKHPSQECAFHYTSGRRDWSRTLASLRTGQRGLYGPSTRAVANGGLLRQIRWARRAGIGIATLHRHLSFMVYPEWIDGMHEIYESEYDVLGGSSMFRAQVLRWGTDRVDGMRGTIGEWPDAQFPLWFPFALAHAGLGGRRLRGWESTSLMEAEPDLIAQMLDYRVKHMAQRVFTLAYHPAHAHGNTFAHGGSLATFLQVLELLRESGTDVRPLRDVYRRASEALQ